MRWINFRMTVIVGLGPLVLWTLGFRRRIDFHPAVIIRGDALVRPGLGRLARRRVGFRLVRFVMRGIVEPAGFSAGASRGAGVLLGRVHGLWIRLGRRIFDRRSRIHRLLARIRLHW